MLGRSEKKNVCAECRHYENCGRPERFMKCLGYEKAVNAERKDNDRCTYGKVTGRAGSR